MRHQAEQMQPTEVTSISNRDANFESANSISMEMPVIILSTDSLVSASPDPVYRRRIRINSIVCKPGFQPMILTVTIVGSL
jgi:hypothetical protein